jgi:hypothetical protein
MNIYTDVEAIVRFCFSNLKGFNVGITDEWNLSRMPLKWAQVA